MRRLVCRGYAADWLVPLLTGLPLLVMLQGLDLDRRVSGLFYDPAGMRFPWKDHWVLKTLLHDGIKQLSVIFAIAVMLLACVSHLYPRYRKYRRLLLTLLGSMLLSAGLVAAIKSVSVPACPHALLIFGGTLPRIGIFDALPAQYVAGHCWPGGNASSAFCLFGFYFAFHARGFPSAARISLAAVMLAGLLLSAVQVMRGMHFLSHEVWTALICWYVSLLMFRASGLHAVPAQGPSHVLPQQRGRVVGATSQGGDHRR